MQAGRSGKKYVEIADIEVYKLARQLSGMAWAIYKKLGWQDRKIMGDQFVESIDSVGANIAEGYGRYHYPDKVKFYYNARGSLIESCNHWLGILREREKVTEEDRQKLEAVAKRLSIGLNNFIVATRNAKQGCE